MYLFTHHTLALFNHNLNLNAKTALVLIFTKLDYFEYNDNFNKSTINLSISII